MKLKKLSTLCLAASTVFAASSAMAWESEDGAWSTSASVALSTDYMWRGMTQTDNEPSISGSFDLGHSSGLYAGIWASNVDFGSDTSLEIDYYAGFAGDIGESGFSYDVGGLYYAYPDQSELDWFEIYGSVSYSFVTAGLAYSDDVYGLDESGIYYTLDAGYDVGPVSLAAGVGYYDMDEESVTGESYTNYYIGASTELAGFTLDLTYHDIDEDSYDALTDNLVFTISKSM